MNAHKKEDRNWTVIITFMIIHKHPTDTSATAEMGTVQLDDSE